MTLGNANIILMLHASLKWHKASHASLWPWNAFPQQFLTNLRSVSEMNSWLNYIFFTQLNFYFFQHMVGSCLESSTEFIQCSHLHTVLAERETISQWTWFWTSQFIFCLHFDPCSQNMNFVSLGGNRKYLGSERKGRIDNSYFCFPQERNAGDAQRYNEIIRHETLRVAVCEMLEGTTCQCPEELRSVIAHLAI